MKSRSFVDEVTLQAVAGRGGDGCVGFRREKYVPLGGPDGGDGGRGGHIILEANRDTDSLIGIYYQPLRRAEPGGGGGGSRSHGRNGRDLVIRVPCGTVVSDAHSGEPVGEVLEHGQQFVVARGGRGGLGNCHWKSSTNRAPTQHTKGEPGEARDLRLELKLIAHVGLVGFPNAGKSSLLGRLTQAHPKVAAYPFTTLHPMMGTLIYDDWKQLTVADIPGLIRGAHEGAGLGHAFLRHIERASVLVYVIDMAGVDGRPPHEDYRTLREELRLHSRELLARPSIVVANKMDLPESADHLRVFKRKTRIRPLPLSAQTGEGIAELREAIRQAWDAAQSEPRVQENGSTSSMDAAPVSSISSRSTPSATPPQGGMPRARAARKSSSGA